jgi:hypothetical protein
MTTVQIVGIAVAAVVVLVLVVALVLTRRRGDAGEGPQAMPEPGGGSFLDEAPQDTFSGLGKAEQPVEEVTIDPAVEREARRSAEAAKAAAVSARPGLADQAPPRTEGGLGLDWGPSGSGAIDSAPAEGAAIAAGAAAAAGAAGAAAAAGAAVGAAPRPDETEVTGEIPAVGPPSAAPEPATPTPSSPIPESGGHAPSESARPAEGGSVAPEAAPESDAGGRMVPLSSIIVTTSRKMVDVQDPEVRRMLTDLVKFEIDQATQFRRDGQTIDAVLQLTEAEKISRALGMEESARRIHEMMQEIQGS